MSLSSQLALEDVGALLLGPSFLMADPIGPLLGQDEEEALSPFSPLSSQGRAPPSPPLSFSSSSSPLSSSPSPPPSPPPATCQPSLFGGSKMGAEPLSFPWLGASDLLDIHVGADNGGDDAFSGMDWMAEKIDLSDLDLDSLIGSCVSDEAPSSPEDLLASLESHMDLDHFAAPPQPLTEALDLGLPLASLPSLPLELHPLAPMMAEPLPPVEVTVKSEPPSPAPSPALSPSYALELGSEVDVLDVDKISSAAPTITAVVPDSGPASLPAPILLSPFVVLLTPKKEDPSLLPNGGATPIFSGSSPSDSESDSGIDSVSDSPPHHSCPSPSPSGSSRTKPYSKPSPPSSPPSTLVTPKLKSVSIGAVDGGTPPKVVEKKLKKMEQNKTAATRYRQKKRVEQDVLNAECSELERRNRELAEKAESISREIQYLRDLMEEVRSAKSRRAAAAGAKSAAGVAVA